MNDPPNIVCSRMVDNISIVEPKLQDLTDTRPSQYNLDSEYACSGGSDLKQDSV